MGTSVRLLSAATVMSRYPRILKKTFISEMYYDYGI